jgi:hypothetical protein
MWITLLCVLCCCTFPSLARPAVSGKGIGKLPGEDQYVEKVLPNDLAWAAKTGDAKVAVDVKVILTPPCIFHS